jgi:N-acetylglucosaminyldiphosphoundecaprenol N-acetyl-beta-D-mannosaminyltransferase
MGAPTLGNISVLGVQFAPATVDELHAYIEQTIVSGGHATVLHVNVHAINLAQSDARLRQILNSASLVFCDGFGVRLGAYILGHRVPPRITYADWMWTLGAFAEQRGFSLFLLGGAPGVAEQAAMRMRERFPALRIVGAQHGYFAKEPGPENDAVLAAINAASPDILLTGFGMPLQEYWLDANWQQIDARVGLTAGAALDYVSGQLRRGPRWMTGYGLEWLARLLIEPRRLWRRYVLGNPQFIARILAARLGAGRQSARSDEDS